MQNDEKYMREALREAQAAAAEGEIPIGAVVVSKGCILGKGHNMTELLHDPTAHAEMIAITAATESIGGKYLTDCTLYVTVEPCPMCAAAMSWCQLGRVVYGAPDPKRGYSLFKAPAESAGGNERTLLHPKTIVEYGVLGDECSKLMKDFFGKLR